jgi:hypothetical protein
MCTTLVSYTRKCGIAGLFLICAEAAQAVIFTVTNTSNSGAGSLAQAILDANAASPPSAIYFNIPGGGVHTIRPTARHSRP